VPVGSLDKIEQSFVVLTDVRLLMVAGNVMPLDTVLVKVVEHTQAGLGCSVDPELSVVGLGDLIVASTGPGLRVASPSGGGFISGGNLPINGRPEPAFDVHWLQVETLGAALEVTQTTGSPDVGDIPVLNKLGDHQILLFCFHGDGVHAPFTALVPGLQPVHLCPVSGGLNPPAISSIEVPSLPIPGEVVPLAVKLPLLEPVSAELKLGEGEERTLRMRLPEQHCTHHQPSQ